MSGRNGRHFEDDIFKLIFFSPNVCIVIQISVLFVPKGLIHNTPKFGQAMNWMAA